MENQHAGRLLGHLQQLDAVAVGGHLEVDAIVLPYERRQAAQGLAHLHLPAAVACIVEDKLHLVAVQTIESFVINGPGSSQSTCTTHTANVRLGCSPFLFYGHEGLVISIDVQDGAVSLFNFCARVETLQIAQSLATSFLRNHFAIQQPPSNDWRSWGLHRRCASPGSSRSKLGKAVLTIIDDPLLKGPEPSLLGYCKICFSRWCQLWKTPLNLCVCSELV